MRVFHESTNQEVKIKKKYNHGVCVCYLINLPKIRNINGYMVYQTIVTNTENLVCCGDGNLEIYSHNC